MPFGSNVVIIGYLVYNIFMILSIQYAILKDIYCMAEGKGCMCEEKIRAVVTQFAKEAEKIYGTVLRAVILYGSCARGDFADDSDIDIMVLLDVAQDEIGIARKKILDVSDQIDLKYDVVLAPVIQSWRLYNQYMTVSCFYQNVQKEGIKFA